MLRSARFPSRWATIPLLSLLLGSGVGEAEAGGHSRSFVVQSSPMNVSQANLVTVQPAGHHFFHHHHGATTAIVSTFAAQNTLQSFAAPTSLQMVAAPTSLQMVAAPTSLQMVAAPTSLQMVAAPTSLQMVAPTSLQSSGFALQASPMTVSFVPQRPAFQASLSSSGSVANPFESSDGLLGAGDSTTNNDQMLLQSDLNYQTLAFRLGDPARVQALKDHLRNRISRQLREDGGTRRRRNWGSFLWRIATIFIKSQFGIDLSDLNRDGASSMEKVIRDILSEESDRLTDPDPDGDPDQENPPSNASGRALRSGDRVIFRGTVEYDGAGSGPKKTQPTIDPFRDPSGGGDMSPDAPEDRGVAAPKPRR